MTEKYVVLAGVVPVYNNQILITQRSLKASFLPGNWGIPAGKIEFGEDTETAAKRELFEETGLTFDKALIVGTCSWLGGKGDIPTHNVQINYLAYTTSDQVVLDDSSEAYRWVPIAEIEDQGLDAHTLKTIRKALMHHEKAM